MERLKTNWKKLVIIILITILLLSFVVLKIFTSDKYRDSQISKAYINYGYDKACEMVVKMYKGYFAPDENKALSWIITLTEEENRLIAQQVELKDIDATCLYGGYLTKYRATIKNNSSHTIDYIEIAVQFYNEDGVEVHRDWTNDLIYLEPNQQIEVSGTTMLDSSYTKYKISVQKVQAEL